MRNIGEAVLDVFNDPDYREVLKGALQEIRDNIAKGGLDEAIKDAGRMNYALSIARPDIAASMITVVMFELAQKETPV